MKKGLFIVLFALFAMSNVNAQFSVGAGGTMFSGGTALELRGSYNVNEKIAVVPYFDYFLSSGTSVPGVNYSFMMYGVDGHYSLGDPEGFDFYPVLGLNIFSISTTFDKTPELNYSGSTTGISAGGGLTYALSDNMKLFAEGRYLQSAFGISAGILMAF